MWLKCAVGGVYSDGREGKQRWPLREIYYGDQGTIIDDTRGSAELEGTGVRSPDPTCSSLDPRFQIGCHLSRPSRGCKNSSEFSVEVLLGKC